MGPGLLLLFVVGDILGTGIYALTGQVATRVGGAVWMPFVVAAFLVAIITAFSYLELVTKYPHAAGAAPYTHKAFGIHFVTFIVAFTVMSSGITSASTASRAFASNLGAAFDLDLGDGIKITLVALAFITLVAIVNFRGVGESVRANVVLTCVELSGLLLIIVIGLWALGGGDGNFAQATQFEVPVGQGLFGAVTAATGLAFFAMVGFEDSVNMAEECKDPIRIFPNGSARRGRPLLQVVEAGASGFPLGVFAFIAMFAVANSALINSADGQPAAVRNEPGARAPCAAGHGPPNPPHAVRRHPVHNRPGVRAHRLRRPGPSPRRDDRTSTTGCVHRRQHRSAGPAPPSGGRQALRRSNGVAGVRPAHLRLSGLTADRPRPGSIPDRRLPPPDRRCAVVTDPGTEPDARHRWTTAAGASRRTRQPEAGQLTSRDVAVTGPARTRLRRASPSGVERRRFTRDHRVGLVGLHALAGRERGDAR
jgi:Amino acid permease